MRRLSYLIASCWLACTQLGFVSPAQAEEFNVMSLSEQEKPVFQLAARSQSQTYPDNLWLASIVPGLGQGLLGEPGRGWLFAGGMLAAIPVGGYLGYALGPALLPNSPPRPGEWDVDLRDVSGAVLGALALGLGVYLYNLADAYSLNQEII